jgi:hypothetical protein
MKARGEVHSAELSTDEDLLKMTSFCQNVRTAVKMLGKIVHTIPAIQGPRIDEEERSEQFWARNRKLENDIDSILEKLKTTDKQVLLAPLSCRSKTEMCWKFAESWTAYRKR